MALAVDSSLAEKRVMDSEATKHMSRNREWFTDYTPLTGKKVWQGDSFLTVHGMGKIILQKICTDGSGKRMTLNNVLHVPWPFTNLLSTAKVKQHGGYSNGRTNTP
jgi:glutamine synthetase type III